MKKNRPCVETGRAARKGLVAFSVFFFLTFATRELSLPHLTSVVVVFFLTTLVSFPRCHANVFATRMAFVVAVSCCDVDISARIPYLVLAAIPAKKTHHLARFGFRYE